MSVKRIDPCDGDYIVRPNGEFVPFTDYDRIRKQRDMALEALKSLVDEEECRLDHHGYCQTHNLGKPCEVAEARAVIASIEAEKKKGGE